MSALAESGPPRPAARKPGEPLDRPLGAWLRRLPVATALRHAFARGYGPADLRADLLAGAVVGVVALPLSMALAIAVGAPPQHGLYTAVVAGSSVALLGGSTLQVTGPTAAFVVVLAPILNRHGLSGLLTAGLMAGLLLVAMGAARLGRLIQYIPHPVTTGFTAGIATVIATLQLKDALGLQAGPLPDAYAGKVAALWAARSTVNGAELLVAASTLALLLLIPRVVKKVPAPLLALALASVGVAAARQVWPGLSVATIGSRFHATIGGVEYAGIPPLAPVAALPWGEGLSLGLVRELLPAAFAIAMLGAIESLLSAVVADGMAGTKHDPDAELVALGVGNIAAALFGGIAATGALARTATNVRAGARSPLAAVAHAAVVLASLVALAPLVAYVPMAALAALLLLVAWNMSDLHSFVGVVKVAPKSDTFVLLTCYSLTVVFDMVIAVSAGVVLAAVLFMRRMAELTEGRAVLEGGPEGPHIRLPEGVGYYEVRGPLFFGAAQKAMAAVHASRGECGVMVLNLGRVSAIDATGLSALDNALGSLTRQRTQVVVAGPLPEPRRVFEKARLQHKYEGLSFAPTLAEAVDEARRLATPPRRA
jgi:sulfate permease, SulP family